VYEFQEWVRGGWIDWDWAGPLTPALSLRERGLVWDGWCWAIKILFLNGSQIREQAGNIVTNNAPQGIVVDS